MDLIPTPANSNTSIEPTANIINETEIDRDYEEVNTELNNENNEDYDSFDSFQDSVQELTLYSRNYENAATSNGYMNPFDEPCAEEKLIAYINNENKTLADVLPFDTLTFHRWQCYSDWQLDRIRKMQWVAHFKQTMTEKEQNVHFRSSYPP